MPSTISQEQLAVVLRRASELERRRRSPSQADEGLSEDELAEVVREIGMSQEDVSRALVELRAGALPATTATPTLGDRLVGPAATACERIVVGDASRIEAVVAEFLRSQLLVVQRDFGDRVTWAPAPGLVTNVKRVLDFGNRISLPKDMTVESLVAPLPGSGGKVIVRLVLGTSEPRANSLRGVLAFIGIGALGVVGGIVAAHDGGLLLGAGGAVVGTAGAVGVRNRYRRNVAGAAVALDRFLDELEHRERRGARR